MDPITHAVIGMTASKITGNGLNFSNPVYTGIVLGSVFPDIDILLQKWGDYVYLKNHRGMTHSFIGLFISSVLIAVVLGGIYRTPDIHFLFIWTFIGCLTHSLFDMLNSYGAKILWPFVKRKYSMNLLITFDPLIIGLLTGFIYSKGTIQYVFLALFILYLVSRVIMKLFIGWKLKKRFNLSLSSISLIPSITGLLSWHFVLDTPDQNIIGDKNILKRNVKVTHKLNKVQDDNMSQVLESKTGKFFSEFTPLFHVGCEKEDNKTKYIFTDMRYCIRNNFLHHAVIEIDENDKMISASFNPYSMNRSTTIPFE